MVYLGYLKDKYFGYTYSKSVMQKCKQLQPSLHFLSIRHIHPEDNRLSEAYQLTIYSLFNKHDEAIDVVSTQSEIHDASQYQLSVVQDYVISPSMDIFLRDALDHLPTKMRYTFREYLDLVGGMIYCDPERDIIDDELIPYEAYLMYKMHAEGEEMGLL